MGWFPDLSTMEWWAAVIDELSSWRQRQAAGRKRGGQKLQDEDLVPTPEGAAAPLVLLYETSVLPGSPMLSVPRNERKPIKKSRFDATQQCFPSFSMRLHCRVVAAYATPRDAATVSRYEI